MAKINKETIDRWNVVTERYLIDTHGITNLGIYTGIDAWAIAHKVGIMKEAYLDPTIIDSHIQTALKKIFPNVIFKDK